MNQPALSRLRSFTKGIISSLRKRYFIVLGLQIENESILGNIKCEWPGNVKIGTECTIHDDVLFLIAHPFSDKNFINIGNNVYLGHRCVLNCSTSITIGNNTMIAANTTLVDAGHGTKIGNTMNKQPVLGAPIIICDDVWIGNGCTILKGLTIGEGSVIGAGSLVNKSIPAYQIWAGTPARFIRDRV